MLRIASVAGSGIAISGNLDAIAGPAQVQSAWRPEVGHGDLVPDLAGILALPPGFRYTIVAQAGRTLLETGQLTPSDPDGTACFSGRNGFVLVNNHEVGGNEPYGVPPLPELTYDPGARGGTTNIEVDRQGNRIREYVSLAGTVNNRAGGVTPWNTWLTCEETEARAGGSFQRDHGYVFEVDPLDRSANRQPVPLKFLGRCAHEAAAVDPQTSAIYLTEDSTGPNGLFYRWTPPAGFRGGKGALRRVAGSAGGATAGQLQAMRCTDAGRHVADLSEATSPGIRYDVTWVDVRDRDAAHIPVRRQFSDGQVTRSRKLEGAWWGEGAYFVASFARTSDGSAYDHDGQVWLYDPVSETVTLTTIFGVTPDQDVAFDGPDSITVSPYGGVLLAEDGDGVNHLFGVSADGQAYPIARGESRGSDEFTGPTFSQDGRILFANLQAHGYVFAITGP